MARTAKVSVTVDGELLEEARAIAGGNLSALVARGLRREVLLARGRELVREWEAERGPVDPELMEQVRRRWPGSSSTPGS